MKKTIIHFEDHGQDFLIWTINEQGQIIDCKPFQFSIWSKWTVTNTDVKIGEHVNIEKDGEHLQVKYPVVKIEIK